MLAQRNRAAVTDVAVRVEHLSKKFRIYNERNQYLKASVLRGRRAKFRDFWALQDVTFDVQRGETFGIIGRNGSGKSTMLKCLARILRPEQGTVHITGSMSALLELGAGFHPELSGRENVYLNGAILGLSRRQIDERFDEIVEFAGLREFIDTPVKNYSSGMFVRLGFAVAINVDPEVLIIDEVLAVGDTEFQEKCADKINDFRDKGRTIILVSHSLSDVRNMCSTVAWIDGGSLHMLGKAPDVVDAYNGASHAGREIATQEGTRWGSGEARITSSEFRHPDGSAVSFPRSGDPLTMRLNYTVFRPIPNPVFGIAIHHREGTLVSATTTRRHGRVIPVLEKDGYVDIVIDHLPLLEGTYELSASISDWTETHQFDHHQGMLRFDVLRGLVVDDGIASLGGRFELSAT